MNLVNEKILLFIFLFLYASSTAQKKLVVMGSSTAVGTGASTYSNSWAGKVGAYYNKNTSDGADTLVYNIAHGGYTSYQEMPTGFTPPANRPSPDENCNVTKALSYSPDVVIINLPTNDITSGYRKKEFMDNLRLMNSTIIQAGVKCYITTSQPRDLSDALRDSLRSIVDSTFSAFGSFAIDFWSDIVTTDGNNNIRPEVSAGDGIHVNDAGHNLLYLQVLSKQIFAADAPLPVRLLRFDVLYHNNTSTIIWQTDNEETGTYYEIQKSANGINFQTFFTKQAILAGSVTGYTIIDQNLLEGKSYYRLKVNETNRVFYSKIISISTAVNNLSIKYLYQSNGNIVTSIVSSLNAPILISIFDSDGSLLYSQKETITETEQKITLHTRINSNGFYFIKVTNSDGQSITKAFIK